jgi:hypothetical protein
MDGETFAILKDDILRALRHELDGWDIEPELLRRLFMTAVAELTDADFEKSRQQM